MGESLTSVSKTKLQRSARDVALQFGAQLVVLFGSAARAEETVADLDIGILCSEPLDAVAITNYLMRALGTQAVDVTDLRRAEPVLLALVARDGIPLFEAQPGTCAKFVSAAMRRFADSKKFRNAQADALRAASEKTSQPRPRSTAHSCVGGRSFSPTWHSDREYCLVSQVL